MENDRYPYALNGLLFGAAVGAGFAAFETAGYALEAGLAQGADGMMESMKLRGALAPFMHVAWTAMVGWAYWRQRALGMKMGEIVTSPGFLKIFAAAVVIHALWNTPQEGPFMLKFILLGIVAWILIISMVQSGLKEVGRRAGSPTDMGLPGAGYAAGAPGAVPPVVQGQPEAPQPQPQP
jgi:RsiW-degrading membrane proteinase PrsW (M82 family)